MAYKIPEFITPKHILELQDYEHNLKSLLNLYPDDIGTEVGGWVYDFMAPIAALEEEIAVYHLPEALKQMFVYWATGFYLDLQAMIRGLERNRATKATGYLEITTDKEVKIESGKEFTTVSTEYNEVQKYIATGEYTINGKGIVKVIAAENGSKGNTNADTVLLQTIVEEGIKKVTNPEPIDGGTDVEDDEHLRQRLIDYDKHYNKSYIGNNYDYKMWSMDVDGVGIADVIAAEEDDGTVTIVLTDYNNKPANEDLIERVRLHIMGTDKNDIARLAPVNAKLKIIPVELVTINIKATIKLEFGHNLEIVKEEYIKKLNEYFLEAKEERVVRFSEIGGALIDTKGVDDYKNLTQNNVAENIPLSRVQIPSIGEVNLNVE